ncbi:lysosomal-associated transmembrane protein 4B [Anabrus simplex]|uniref:lysosomal-associated transmembrane protein 4B n=1 Tax=Anabrus simplex TaxID=316456 RepID=UPI0035A2D299
MTITVKQCCCGCTLKTGTIIIGVLYGLGALAGLVSNIMKAGAEQMSPEIAKHLNFTEEMREQYNNIIRASSYINIVVAIILCLQLILCILLVYGANNENPRLIRPWIIYSIVSVTLSSIIYLILMILSFVYLSAASGIAILIGTALYIALSAYFIIVVNSFHLDLVGQRNPSKI